MAVSALACLALGWWQWERFEAVGGNGQNLGYAFQWPLFAAFVVYAYRKFVKLEDETQAAEDDTDSTGASDRDTAVREIPADLLPKRPERAADDASPETDLESQQLREYNSYLAELDRSRE